MKVKKTKIPAGSLVEEFLPADYADSFRCEMLPGDSRSADDIQVAFWTDMPRWVEMLMNLRNAIVRPFGLNTERNERQEFIKCIREGGRCGFAAVSAKSANETVLLLSDKHLDAYLSIHIMDNGENKILNATTLVVFRNKLGPVYFYTVRPFHEMIVRKMLRRVVKNTSNHNDGRFLMDGDRSGNFSSFM